MGILSEKMESVGQEAYLYAHDVAALEARIGALERMMSPTVDEVGLTDTLRHIARAHPCCRGSLLDAAARIEALEKLYLRHIHGHRLGTDETADECPSCRQLMENQIIALRSEEE